MLDNDDRINQLLGRLEILLKRQDEFSTEINELRSEIDKLVALVRKPAQEAEESEIPIPQVSREIKPENGTNYHERKPTEDIQETVRPTISPVVSKLPRVKLDLEKFIGENLINKIGIAITVIGVAIGVKYAIDHQLISPLTRVVLGYLTGVVLLVFAIRLKRKYEDFSAVLLSGSMAIMYFMTYSAYSFYGLIPQLLAFALMVVLTAFTVMAAIQYDRQVIAHIGLVGAYAVPFLLSDGSGKVATLFTYMAIINAGILVIAFKKYWKPLYYSSFGLTWLIYASWCAFDYRTTEHFGLALTFLFLFFGLFYLTFLAYKLIQREKFETGDIVLLLLNSFIFYGIGYALLNGHEIGGHLLGLFTLGNAIVHFVVSVIIYRQKLADKNLFYVVCGLVLVFITAAILVQLDGNWVTLLWIGEAALLFWIGRTKHVPIYEKMSYPLMVLAFLSIVHDWMTGYNVYYAGSETWIMPMFNVNFLTSFLFLSAFGFINVLNFSKKYPLVLANQSWVFKAFSHFFIPGILFFTAYYAFRMEISNYWNQLYEDSLITVNPEGEEYPGYFRNYDLIRFKIVWIINYSLFFVSVLALVNFRKLRNQTLGLVSLSLIVLTLAVFLTQGLLTLSELRESYLGQVLAPGYYKVGVFHIGIRYVSFAFVALALAVTWGYIWRDFMRQDFHTAYDFLLHVTVLWIASSELIGWMDIAASTQSYKLGLSILWGAYSLLLIVLGIWKKKKHLRVGAIALFTITLVKLFFYDISHLDTLDKTVVFVSLGALLLIISFLYNKYKLVISDDTDR